MKKILFIAMLGLFLISTSAHAQVPVVNVVTSAIKKVIRAIDLQIQKQQNKVIWLQNAQRQLENTMAKMRLDDISQWAEKQRKLYADYFDELKKVKAILATYSEVKRMIGRQQELIGEYSSAWNLLKQDKHFTPQELQYMSSVYAGILNESLANIELLQMVITSFSTQMSDAKRLELIHKAGAAIDRNITVLRGFTTRNVGLSLSRAADEKEAGQLKQWYGLQ